MKVFALQVEVLRRLRNGGQQYVRVEHVYVNGRDQAIIGNVKKTDFSNYEATPVTPLQSNGGDYLVGKDILDADKRQREQAKRNRKRSIDKLHRKLRDIVERKSSKSRSSSGKR